MIINFSFLSILWRFLRHPKGKNEGLKSIFYLGMLSLCVFLYYTISKIPILYNTSTINNLLPKDSTESIVNISQFYDLGFGIGDSKSGTYDSYSAVNSMYFDVKDGSVKESYDSAEYQQGFSTFITDVKDYLSSNNEIVPSEEKLNSICSAFKIIYCYSVLGSPLEMPSELSMSLGLDDGNIIKSQCGTTEKGVFKSNVTDSILVSNVAKDNINSSNYILVIDKMWKYFFAPFDVSQSINTYEYYLEGVDSVTFEIRFTGLLNASLLNHIYAKYEQSNNSFSFHSKINGKERKMYSFYISYPYLQNFQNFRIFLLGILLTLFFSLWTNSTYNFIINKIRISKRLKQR